MLGLTNEAKAWGKKKKRKKSVKRGAWCVTEGVDARWEMRETERWGEGTRATRASDKASVLQPALPRDTIHQISRNVQSAPSCLAIIKKLKGCDASPAASSELCFVRTAWTQRDYYIMERRNRIETDYCRAACSQLLYYTCPLCWSSSVGLLHHCNAPYAPKPAAHNTLS